MNSPDTKTTNIRRRVDLKEPKVSKWRAHSPNTNYIILLRQLVDKLLIKLLWHDNKTGFGFLCLRFCYVLFVGYRIFFRAYPRNVVHTLVNEVLFNCFFFSIFVFQWDQRCSISLNRLMFLLILNFCFKFKILYHK